MKLMFVSDIHGSAYYAKKAVAAYEQEKADKLILLGDLLYHGPRNDLPKEYAPKQVIKMLNELKKEIIAVRGNCDAEVDQMVLDFPMMADYATIDVDGHHFFLSHGHIFSEEKLPYLNEGDVFVYGHIHKPVAKYENGIYILNPSSISLPKEGNNSYGIYENDEFIIKEFDGTVVKRIRMD
ncbi:phosphodiesterase [uncultured Thomasclavelia sp.]|uniref:phosphodiesterase n=1 Tax=uncultured Thomasclavelia sp. TaxID=3025759 RepID=UPI0025D01B0A|nr:phosphodiesterase [uncultured Thomasclavelia sp.]